MFDESKNAAALKAAQIAYDNLLPDDGDDVAKEVYIHSQVSLLLEGYSADRVAFMPAKGYVDFVSEASDLIADRDNSFLIPRLVVALLAGDTLAAFDLAEKFRDALSALAYELVEKEEDKL